MRQDRQTMNFGQGTLVLSGLLYSTVSWLFLKERMPNARSYEMIFIVLFCMFRLNRLFAWKTVALSTLANSTMQ